MKKRLLRANVYIALATLLASVVAQASASAQGPQKGQSQAGQLEGTWLVQVTLRNCQTGDPVRTFPSLLSYARGGVVIATTSSIPPALNTPGQGVWRHVGGHSYAATYMLFRFNPDGSFAGTQRIIQDIQLSNDADELNITATFEVLNANGDVIATGCVTTVGRRLGFE